MAARKKAAPAQVTLDTSAEKFQTGGNLFPTPKMYTSTIPAAEFENIQKASGASRAWTGFMENGDYQAQIVGLHAGYNGKDTIVGFFHGRQATAAGWRTGFFVLDQFAKNDFVGRYAFSSQAVVCKAK